jgi:hypothetical protein
MNNDWKCPNCGGINPSSRLTCLGCNTNKPNVPAKTTINNYKNIKTSGIRNILFGAFWFFGGIIATIYSYSSALSGGTYIIAWGAIIFGGIQLLRGLSQYSSVPSDTQKPQMTKISTMGPIKVNPPEKDYLPAYHWIEKEKDDKSENKMEVGVHNLTKKCPFCAEEIKYEAIVCRYCGRELPIQKDVEITSNKIDTDHPLQQDKLPEQEKADMKPHIILISIVILLIGLTISIPFVIGLFQPNSSPPTRTPNPSPTKSFTMTMVPPTIRPYIYPSATKSYFEQYCVTWSSITLVDVGKRICVYGNVYNISSDNTAYYISFSNKNNTFYLISYDIYFPDLRAGDCVYATGVIKKLNNSPVITLLPSDNLYKCH